MAFPIHPSRSDYDLMYSVLYDDFTAENAIKIIAILDYQEPFDPPPFVPYQVRVTYGTSEGGSLSGKTSEYVWYGEHPANVPTPVDSKYYEFRHWEDVHGNIVVPTEVAVTEDTEFTAVFEYIPPASYNVTYVAGENGHLTGQTVEAVIEGEYPKNVPTPVADTDYVFTGWFDETWAEVDPTTVVITEPRTFTAHFEYAIKKFNVTLYNVAPRTTSATNHNISTSYVEVEEGDYVSPEYFSGGTGIILNRAGEYSPQMDESITEDTFFQKIDNSEQITTSNNYYRKTFYAGVGGHLVSNGSVVYAHTAQARTWGGTQISTPTPEADSGWHFSHWINLANGQTVSNPSSGTTTTKYAAIFVED